MLQSTFASMRHHPAFESGTCPLSSLNFAMTWSASSGRGTGVPLLRLTVMATRSTSMLSQTGIVMLFMARTMAFRLVIFAGALGSRLGGVVELPADSQRVLGLEVLKSDDH